MVLIIEFWCRSLNRRLIRTRILQAMNSANAYPAVVFDVPSPYTEVRTVQPGDIDRLGHTNNVVYLGWLEAVAWAHSVHLGLGWELYQRINAGFVARRHTLDYLRATFVDHELHVATCITDNPRRVIFHRAYLIVLAPYADTVLPRTTPWPCVHLQTRRARPTPPQFAHASVAVCSR